MDTHGRTHHAAIIDQQGRLLGDQELPADSGGYRLLLSWLSRHWQLDAVGVEGTGSYGAGLTHTCWISTSPRSTARNCSLR